VVVHLLTFYNILDMFHGVILTAKNALLRRATFITFDKYLSRGGL
jgi:hypothetical protein